METYNFNISYFKALEKFLMDNLLQLRTDLQKYIKFCKFYKKSNYYISHMGLGMKGIHQSHHYSIDQGILKDNQCSLTMYFQHILCILINQDNGHMEEHKGYIHLYHQDICHHHKMSHISIEQGHNK